MATAKSTKSKISEVRFILRHGTTKLCSWAEVYRPAARPARGAVVRLPHPIQAMAGLTKFRATARVERVATTKTLKPGDPSRLIVFLRAIPSA